MTNPAAEAASVSSPACYKTGLIYPLENIYSPQRQDTRCLFSLKKINAKITLKKCILEDLEMTNTEKSLSQIRGFFQKAPRTLPRDCGLRNNRGQPASRQKHKRPQGFHFGTWDVQGLLLSVGIAGSEETNFSVVMHRPSVKF